MIARNIFYNLAGLTVPVLLAFACIPFLIKGMGVERFGLLTLVWVVLGYFSLFDIGIGRALTKILAGLIAEEKNEKLGVWLRTGAITAATCGLLVGIALFFSAAWIAEKLAPDAPELWLEVTRSLVFVGFALPFVTATAALRGALEAKRYFGLTNIIRIGMGFFSYLGPLLVITYENSLSSVVGFLVFGRVIFFLLHLFFCVKKYGAYTPKTGENFFSIDLLSPLFSLSGWMAVSNFISPVLTYLDRILVSSIVGAAVLAYYTTPYEGVMKITLIPDAVNGVLFPALVAALVEGGQRAGVLFSVTFRFLLATLLPVTTLLILFSSELLGIWLGVEFSNNSSFVLQTLALGVLINSLARLPYTVIQSAGRPDITAKIHIVELPVFILTLWYLTKNYGIQGAAIAWVVRVTVDLFILEVFRRKFLNVSIGMDRITLSCLTGVIFLCVGAIHFGSGLLEKTILYIAIVFVSLGVVLKRSDRKLVLETVSKRRHKKVAV